MKSLGTNDGEIGGRRRIEEEIELLKQRLQAIATRLLNESSKQLRTVSDSSSPSPSISSSQSSFPVPYDTQTNQYNSVPSSKKICIPNTEVGVIIGRGGDMIKNLELESGARIQITPDADADPTSLTRDVELMGTQEQISRAEEQINEVIAAADSTNSASFGDRSAPPPQAGGERLVIKVPNEKVGLIIGKGGKSIKAVQSMSGARIQVIPLHCPPGDYSTKRNIYINGTMKQIEYAEELVYEVMSGNPLKYQGYPQQPNHGQDGQATPEAKPYAYGPPATSSQPDGSAAVQTSQQGYETRVAYGSDGTAQSQPPSAYATGYGQPPPHGNGYNVKI